MTLTGHIWKSVEGYPSKQNKPTGYVRASQFGWFADDPPGRRHSRLFSFVDSKIFIFILVQLVLESGEENRWTDRFNGLKKSLAQAFYFRS